MGPSVNDIQKANSKNNSVGFRDVGGRAPYESQQNTNNFSMNRPQ